MTALPDLRDLQVEFDLEALALELEAEAAARRLAVRIHPIERIVMRALIAAAAVLGAVCLFSQTSKWISL